jgi:hypothetical protein
MFNRGEGGFRDRDLQVLCANALDGVVTANATHKGARLEDLKDVKGFTFGKEIMRVATDAVKEITYLWPRPGSDTPVQKVMFFTIVQDQICGVSYYR